LAALPRAFLVLGIYKKFLHDMGSCQFVQMMVEIRRSVSLLYDAAQHQVHDAFELGLSH